MKTRVYISDINLALSSDEIIEIEKCYIGRNNHYRSFKIKGKIFTGLTDEQIEKSDILLMAKQKNEDYFPEKTREVLQEIYSNLDINDMEKNLKERVYEYNRENIRKITRWSNSPKDCYHRLIIETIFEEESPEFLIIPLVFVKKFNINISSEKGVGGFELLLYEKFVLNETSFKIYMGDKKDFRSISQNNMVIQNKKFENSYIYDEDNKESADIEVITENYNIKDEKYDITMIFNISLGKLTVITPKETFDIKATSGKDEYLNNSGLESQKAKNKGVLPVGEYIIKPSDLSDPDFLGDIKRNLPKVGADWGDWRVRLYNKKGVFYNRNDFFLHGGSLEGSAGCVDIGGGIFGNENTDKVKKIIKNSSDNILFKVIGEEKNE